MKYIKSFNESQDYNEDETEIVDITQEFMDEFSVEQNDYWESVSRDGDKGFFYSVHTDMDGDIYITIWYRGVGFELYNKFRSSDVCQKIVDKLKSFGFDATFTYYVTKAIVYIGYYNYY